MAKKESRIGTLYIITNDINNKVYIGKTYSSLRQRWKLHRSDAKKDKTKRRPLYNAMKKYGEEHFTINEIAKFPEGLLEEKEKEYIQLYNSYYNGYNATKGGEGVLKDNKYSPEQEEMIVELFFIYPNVSYIAKMLNTNYKTVDRILMEKGLTKLTQPQLKRVENIMWIYQLDNNQIKNVFTNYTDVKNYLSEEKIIETNLDSIRGSINYSNKNNAKVFGYNWKIVHLKNVFEDYVREQVKNNLNQRK